MLRVGLVMFALVVSLGNAAEPPTKIASSVVLRYPGTKPLGADDAQKLRAKALEILRSSNFNSTSRSTGWDKAQTNLDYGAAVSRKHLLVTFVDPETITTVGGKVVVKEIIIGLNGEHYASSLHTVDDQGRIVGHGKYNGTLCVQLLELVKALPQ